jgi:hypothetical protein
VSPSSVGTSAEQSKDSTPLPSLSKVKVTSASTKVTPSPNHYSGSGYSSPSSTSSTTGSSGKVIVTVTPVCGTKPASTTTGSELPPTTQTAEERTVTSLTPSVTVTETGGKATNASAPAVKSKST